MMELRIITAGQPMPIFDLPSILGKRKAYQEIGDQIDALIAFSDQLAGDPDLEDDDPDTEHDGREPDCDGQGDRAWAEWDTRGRHKLQSDHETIRGRDGWTPHEDDEDDDPLEANGDEHDTGNAEDDELAGSGVLARHGVISRGPGCPISDPDMAADDLAVDGDEGV